MSIIAGAMQGIGQGVAEFGKMAVSAQFDAEKEQRLEAIKEKWYAKERADRQADKADDRAYTEEQAVKSRADAMSDYGAKKAIDEGYDADEKAAINDLRKAQADAYRSAAKARTGGSGGGSSGAGQIIYDNDGNAFSVNKRTGETTPVYEPVDMTNGVGVGDDIVFVDGNPVRQIRNSGKGEKKGSSEKLTIPQLIEISKDPVDPQRQTWAIEQINERTGYSPKKEATLPSADPNAKPSPTFMTKEQADAYYGKKPSGLISSQMNADELEEFVAGGGVPKPKPEMNFRLMKPLPIEDRDYLENRSYQTIR